MRIVIGGAGMAETAIGRASVGQRPGEGARGGVEQGAIAGDAVELRQACNRPAVLAGVGGLVDRRLRAGTPVRIGLGIEDIAMLVLGGVGVLAGVEGAAGGTH